MLSKVLSLDKLSCPQIWNIEQEKDREKEKVVGRPAKLNEKRGNIDLEREMKNKGIPNNALFGEASPRGPIPYPYIYNFLDKRYHFRVTSIEKLYPFHISA